MAPDHHGIGNHSEAAVFPRTFPPVSLLFGTVSLLQEGDARRHFSALH